MKSLALEWIKKAEEDYAVAERELRIIPPIFTAVCFHCQQCMEKYMKGILAEHDAPFEKTHDLDLLLEKCKKYIPQIGEHKLQLSELSSFAVEIRYPGTEATRDEAEQFFALVSSVRTIFREYLSL